MFRRHVPLLFPRASVSLRRLKLSVLVHLLCRTCDSCVTRLRQTTTDLFSQLRRSVPTRLPSASRVLLQQGDLGPGLSPHILHNHGPTHALSHSPQDFPRRPCSRRSPMSKLRQLDCRKTPPFLHQQFAQLSLILLEQRNL
jgi:hypothetical protein